MRSFRHDKKYILSGRRTLFSSWFYPMLFILLLGCTVSIFFLLVKNQDAAMPSHKEIYKDWNNKQYVSVYEKTSLLLVKYPLDGVILSLHGFASYYLSIEQADSTSSQEYLQEAINSLRNAWYRVSENDKPQIAYVLGKAYYQRGFYYADLADKYLETAALSEFVFDDIHEFRGMTAALLGDYESSTASFLIALAKKPSDLLLFALANNYTKTEDWDKAQQYLLETVRVTNDDLLVMKCRYELGLIFIKLVKLEEARIEFESILEKDQNSADAHYGLGVIYESQGDMIKARAEWRKAVKSNPIHIEARNKLNM